MHNTLTHLALFDITGVDAAHFLHGQLTQDMMNWQAGQIKRAAWCNPKGRMLASFYIWQIEGGFRALVAQNLASKIITRLRMFVLRAKVIVCDALGTAIVATKTQNKALSHDGTTFTLLESGFGFSLDPNLARSDLDWFSQHIQAGVAWIDASNSEQFVPQTVNFELVSGVDFKKGCYPGQEIVARSQYLGKLKQRAAIAILGSTNAIAPLSDVFTSAEPNPVGRVIMAAAPHLLIEAPQSLLQSATALYLGSPEGEILTVLTLPYPVLDITA